MAPFGFVPFSNTLPALALLFLAAGLIQRDGVAVLLGYLANEGTIIYFGIMIGGGGVGARELLTRLAACSSAPQQMALPLWARLETRKTPEQPETYRKNQ